jgi:hypothetical protein
MSLEQEPTADTGNNQEARSDCQHRALPPRFVSSTEFIEVAIAGAAGTQMIEPLFRFIEWHGSKCDPLQNVRTWTSAVFGIWKLLEQTTAKCVQEPLFFSRRISFFVQPFLLASNLHDCISDLNSTPMRFRGLWARAVHHPNNVLPDLFQVVLEFHFGLLFCDAKPFRNFFPRKPVLSRLPNFPRPTIHAVCYLPNGNSAFKLFSPIRIHGGFKTFKV